MSLSALICASIEADVACAASLAAPAVAAVVAAVVVKASPVAGVGVAVLSPAACERIPRGCGGEVIIYILLIGNQAGG
jgi:hypothetical protein